MPFAATQMDLEIITLSDGSQTETNTKQFSYTWNPKYDTNELIYETKKKKLRHREQICGGQGRGEVGRGWTESLGLADANSCVQNG